MCIELPNGIRGGNFSIDSWLIAKEQYLGQFEEFVGSYRFVSALIVRLYRLFCYDPIGNSDFGIIIHIILVSIVLTWVTSRVHKEFNEYNLFVIDLSFLVCVINCWFCDYLSYPECILMVTAGTFLAFTAIGLISGGGQSQVVNYIFVVLCLVLASGVFQQFFAVFGVYAIALCCMRYGNNKSVKENISTFILPVVSWFISGVIYIIVAKVLCVAYGVPRNSRTIFSIKGFLDNIYYIFRHAHSYVKGRGFFHGEVLTLCFILINVIWLVCVMNNYIKTRNKVRLVFSILSYVAVIVISLLAGIISCTHDTRALFPFFGVYGFLILTSLHFENRIVKQFGLGILILVIGLNIGKTMEYETNLKKVNMADQLWSSQVCEEIRYHEEVEGIKITNIAFCSDEHSDISGDMKSYAVSAATVEYARNAMIKSYFKDHELNVVEMPEEVYQMNFSGRDWKCYFPSQQILFSEDTVYVCSY